VNRLAVTHELACLGVQDEVAEAEPHQSDRLAPLYVAAGGVATARRLRPRPEENLTKNLNRA
jgi:hypothetical protein